MSNACQNTDHLDVAYRLLSDADGVLVKAFTCAEKGDANGAMADIAWARRQIDHSLTRITRHVYETRRSEPKPQDAASVAAGMAAALPESNPSTEESNHA